MSSRMTTVLQRLKTEWAVHLQPEAILAACEAVGYTEWRDRLLHPVVTVQAFLLQILHGNTACRHLPHLSGLTFSASAYCQARTKLPLGVLEHLLERLVLLCQILSEHSCLNCSVVIHHTTAW